MVSLEFSMSLSPNDTFTEANTLAEAIDLFLYREVQHSGQKHTGGTP